jgi:hypothetical protein
MTAGCVRHHVASSFAELAPHLKTGQTIYVTTTNGEEQKGPLETLSASHARLDISGTTVQVPEREIARIALREPLWQGGLTGGGAGAVMGAVGQQTAQSYDCFWGGERSCESQTPVQGLFSGAVLGAMIGTCIDALVWRRTTVFLPPDATHPRLAVAPIAGRGTASVRVTARF